MLQRVLRELRRRRVPQVGGVYLALAWALFEASESVLPRLGLEDSAVTLVMWLLILGFPLTVGLAWAFDVTPDGVRRTGGTVTEAAEAGSGPGPPTDSPAAAGIRRIAVVGAIVMLAVAGGAFLLLDGDTPVEARLDELAVLPFSVRGAEDMAVLGDGMVELLGSKLQSAGGVRATDSETVLRLADGTLDPATADRLAERLGAARYVRGSVLEYGGDLRLHAALYRRGRPEDPVAAATVEGPVESFLDLVDDLASDLVTASELAPPGRMPRAAALTTDSFAALTAFLEGERAYRDTRYDTAILRLERAVEIDSAFALAHYRLAVAAWWAERGGLLREALSSASRHSDRLSERDRALVEAFAAARSGRHGEAERRYRRIVAAYPDDLEAWYQLGEVIFHRGHLLGLSIVDSWEAFSRVVDVDPGHGEALFHLSNIATGMRDLVLLDSVLGLVQRRTGSLDPVVEAERAFAVGDSAGMEEALDLIASGKAPSSTFVFAMIGADELEPIRRIAAAVRAGVPPALRPAAVPWVAGQLVSFGQRDEALGEIERAELGSPEPDPLRVALFASYPFLKTPAGQLAEIRDRLRAWDAGPVLSEPVQWNPARPHAAMQPHVRAYLLALIEARLGRPHEALRLAAELEGLGGTERVRQLSADLVRHVRAQVALDQGRPEIALAEIESASFWNELHWDERFSGVFSQQGSIIVRAEALQALGRQREALRWYRAGAGWPRLRSYCHYRSGEAYEAAGFPDRAAVHYGKFIRRWADADPELQPLVADAEKRLLNLSAEGADAADSEPLYPYW